MKVKKIGVLTGGGDAPGLNPAIKGVVYKADDAGVTVTGIRDGWAGLLAENWKSAISLDRLTVRRWDRDGGTNIGSSRTNPFRVRKEGKGGREAKGEPQDLSDEVLKNSERLGLDAVVVMGGEDTLGVAVKLAKRGLKIVGVPKTIDNDLSSTDYTLGFDTALRNCTDVIERARTPAGSHHWVQVVEVMGRHTGHLAFWSGVAGGAQIILIPEHKFIYKRVYELLEKRLSKGEKDPRYPRYAVIVVSEGASAEDEEVVTVDTKLDAFGHVRLGGVGEVLSQRIRHETPYDSRAVILGHPQRGGPPDPVDRIMGRLFGAKAADMALSGEWGRMVSAKGIAPACEITTAAIEEAVVKLKLFDVGRHYDTGRYNSKF